MTLKFMGQEFDNREALARAYPKFASEGAIRAIKRGASTPLEVEQFCYDRMNKGSVKERIQKQIRDNKARVDRLDGKSARLGKIARKRRRKAA